MTREFPGYVRAIAVVIGFGILFISIFFSVSGFEVAMSERVWMGWAMGAIITGIEVVWNKVGRGNLTIGVVGLLAYSYGVWTNYEGIMATRGTLGDSLSIFAIIFALFLEISAEPVIIMGITGRAESDPISEIIKNITGMFGSIVSAAQGGSRIPSPPPPPIMAGGNGHPREIVTPMGRRISYPPPRK